MSMKNECSLGLRLVSGVRYQECESQMDEMLMVAAIEMTYAGYKHKLLNMFSLFFASFFLLPLCLFLPLSCPLPFVLTILRGNVRDECAGNERFDFRLES